MHGSKVIPKQRFGSRLLQDLLFYYVQERLSVLAARTFHFARLRSAGGVYLSGGLKPATETSRILTYPLLIEAGIFPTEIKSPDPYGPGPKFHFAAKTAVSF